jgi:hypothetical protein
MPRGFYDRTKSKKRPKTGKYIFCSVCKKQFYAPLNRIKRYKILYCCQKCCGIGQRGKHISSKTEFKKGHPAPKTAFKKGNIPYYKLHPEKILRGEKAPRWKGGITYRGKYRMLYKPEHPFCTGQGYIPEHRLIMEKYLGRYLNPKERVHHINHDIKDNRIENLQLFKSNSEHSKHHFPKGSYFGIHA